MFLETPTALWLFPAGVLALLLLQFWQARRHELLVGSLLVWRRVAEKERARPRRRLVLDRSFWLQVAALLTISLAWSNPVWSGRSAPGRRFVVVLDNGPSARARLSDGQPVWNKVQASARDFLSRLADADRVILCTGVPFSKHLPSNDGVPRERALDELARISPGLSPVDSQALWRLALDEARLWSRSSAELGVQTLVFSVRPEPVQVDGHEQAHWVSVPSGAVVSNVAVTAYGTTAASDPEPHELLIQVRNFGGVQAEGTLRCELREGSSESPREITLAPGEVRAEVFSFQTAFPALRVVWQARGMPDALPEDDSVTLIPRLGAALRTRWHGTAPHLQALFREALSAEELALDAKETADLDIYVESLPTGIPGRTRGVLLLAPPSSYGPFEVLPDTLKRPVAHVGDGDPLMRGLVEGTGGLDWPVAEARTIRQVGDLRTLALDGQGNQLAFRFMLKDGRPGYAFAFVPGEGLGWAPGRRFDSPGLAAVLLRILRESAGADQPLALRSAEAIEQASGKPLPLDWRPDFDQEKGVGQGVLDIRTSDLQLAGAGSARVDAGSLVPASAPQQHSLWPLFVLLTIVLILAEVRVADRVARTSLHLSAPESSSQSSS